MTTQPTAAVRATAAALAVFATLATLNGVVSMADPQRGESMAQSTASHATATLRQTLVVAQATPSVRSH